MATPWQGEWNNDLISQSLVFSYPIPGEKPYIPDATNSAFDRRERFDALGAVIANSAPKIYMRYPQYMFEGMDAAEYGSADHYPSGCSKCLQLAADYCSKCQRREDECLQKCPQIACPRVPSECRESFLKDDLHCYEHATCEEDLNGWMTGAIRRMRVHDGWHGLYGDCQWKILPMTAAMAAECFTLWSGRLDPK